MKMPAHLDEVEFIVVHRKVAVSEIGDLAGWTFDVDVFACNQS